MVVWAIVVSRCPPTDEWSRIHATVIAVDLAKASRRGFSRH
jgi:hypothetical protein